jgi:hypothetical protein
MLANSCLVNDCEQRVPLVAAAAAIGMSPNGLFYILQKTNSAIRDDGRWYCTVATIERIRKARRDVGTPIKAQQRSGRVNERAEVIPENVHL